MGICVKRMEMPDDCRNCPFEMYYMNCGETRCRATGKILADFYKPIPFEGRAEECPLIELPTPHGRLIDADALLESIKEARKKDPEIEDVYIDDYFTVAEWVVSAPTIVESDIDVMYYPQVDGITPTVIKTEAEDGT